MLVYDIIMGLSLFASIYFEYEYSEGRAQEEKKETDPVNRFSNFSVRIKSISIILGAIIYFIIRLYMLW